METVQIVQAVRFKKNKIVEAVGKRDRCMQRSGSRSMSSWLRDAGQAKLLEVDMDLTRTRVTFLYIPFNSIQFFFFQSTSSKHNSRYLLSFCQYILQRDSYDVNAGEPVHYLKIFPIPIIPIKDQ